MRQGVIRTLKCFKMADTVGEFKVHFRQELGQGTFGNVYKADNKAGKTIVAAKKISLCKDGLINERLWDLASTEFSILEQLQDHPNIVRLLGHHQEAKHMWVFMELCELGNLQSFMKYYMPEMREKLKIMHQCADTIDFMHNRKPQIVHRDIKPANVLMKSLGREYIVKISDFGIRKVLEGVDFEKNQAMETIAGTMAFMAPEFFEHFEGNQKLEYHPPVDTFSLGLLFQTILIYTDDDACMIPRTGIFRIM